MKLQSFHVEIVELPLRVPFRTALRATSTVTDIRVTLVTDDGITGVGSAAPTPAITGDTTGGIVSALKEHILPSLSKIDLADSLLAFETIERSIVHNTSAKAAADIALHDLYARQTGVSLLQFLGSTSNKTIETDATVSLGDIQTMVTQAQDLVNAGFKVLKVKLGNRDGLDVERMAAIRNALGRDVTLRVDANQAWTAKETLKYVDALFDYQIELIEQPVPAHDILGLREITERSPIPIAADESVYGLYDLLRVIDLRAADIVNIKLMKSAGLNNARQMIGLARAAGMDWMIGSMMEGPASVTAAASLAMAYNCRYIDLDAAYFLRDGHATGGITYDGPSVKLPSGLGLEVTFLPNNAHQA